MEQLEKFLALQEQRDHHETEAQRLTLDMESMIYGVMQGIARFHGFSIAKLANVSSEDGGKTIMLTVDIRDRDNGYEWRDSLDLPTDIVFNQENSEEMVYDFLVTKAREELQRQQDKNFLLQQAKERALFLELKAKFEQEQV